MTNSTCPCCMEPFNSDDTVILSFTNDELRDMELNGIIAIKWSVYDNGNHKLYILKINDHIDLPFTSIDQIVKQFGKTEAFYEDCFYNLVSINQNKQYLFRGTCNHNICMICRDALTENKCPLCRTRPYLYPSPMRTIDIGRILWEDNYNDDIPPLISDDEDNDDIPTLISDDEETLASQSSVMDYVNNEQFNDGISEISDFCQNHINTLMDNINQDTSPIITANIILLWEQFNDDNPEIIDLCQNRINTLKDNINQDTSPIIKDNIIRLWEKSSYINNS